MKTLRAEFIEDPKAILIRTERDDVGENTYVLNEDYGLQANAKYLLIRGKGMLGNFT